MSKGSLYYSLRVLSTMPKIANFSAGNHMEPLRPPQPENVPTTIFESPLVKQSDHSQSKLNLPFYLDKTVRCTIDFQLCWGLMKGLEKPVLLYGPGLTAKFRFILQQTGQSEKMECTLSSEH